MDSRTWPVNTPDPDLGSLPGKPPLTVLINEVRSTLELLRVEGYRGPSTQIIADFVYGRVKRLLYAWPAVHCIIIRYDSYLIFFSCRKDIRELNYVSRIKDMVSDLGV